MPLDLCKAMPYSGFYDKETFPAHHPRLPNPQGEVRAGTRGRRFASDRPAVGVERSPGPA